MDLRMPFGKKPHEIKEKSFKRFNEWSKKYDKSVLQYLVFRRSHDMFIKHIESHKKTARVLDIGCGTGEFAVKVKQHKKDIDVFGIDISSEMVNIAKEKARSMKGVNFQVGDVEDMPYEDSYFDYLTCAHSFHHYPHKKKAVREMFRVLKNGGEVMIIDGCKDGAVGKVIFDFIVKRHEIDIHHLHSDQYQRILTRAGFKDIDQFVFNPLIPLLFTKGVACK